MKHGTTTRLGGFLGVLPRLFLAAGALASDVLPCSAGTPVTPGAATFSEQISSGIEGSIVGVDLSLDERIEYDYSDQNGQLSARSGTYGGRSPIAEALLDKNYSTFMRPMVFSTAVWQVGIVGTSTEIRNVPLIVHLQGHVSLTGPGDVTAFSGVSNDSLFGSQLLISAKEELSHGSNGGTAIRDYDVTQALTLFGVPPGGTTLYCKASVSAVGSLFNTHASLEAIAGSRTSPAPAGRQALDDPDFLLIDPAWEFAHEFKITYSANLFPSTPVPGPGLVGPALASLAVVFCGSRRWKRSSATLWRESA